MTVLVVTGTGTGVGKTIATAALAASAIAEGLEVAVCKPVQSGAETDDDLAEVGRLAGASHLVSVARYPAPLAPAAAAHLAGRRLPSAAEILAAVTAADRPGRLTLLEGAGGLLVELAAGGETLRDLAAELGAAVLVVCEAGLGTLNHTALTLEACASRNLRCAGLVIGSWPSDPGPAEVSNRDVLARMAPLRGVLPAGSGALARSDFAVVSAAALDTRWLVGLVAGSH